MRDDVFLCAPGGTPLRDTSDLMDVLGEAAWGGARWVAMPVERLHDDFFSLRTGVAGEIAQKFANYRVGLAIVGDVSRHVAASTAFRDWVRESERGRHVWFVRDLEELEARLTDG
ncbi:DUF4180 domain-containing protein [Nonomuraea rhodomycinica]|uniref:DUF4180 domain-containing protein n=1 Tax=Nonomuraea rhodomycinica TaxID=1712872 RepID=A0A7Y6INL7_9ACTN|nr:DUF4180 domain-containing protein [Nonomuraea rhodomycinica]NUW40224.1 DUF4180 domain-containing protein [Nonomuraea rhodomycinica]